MERDLICYRYYPWTTDYVMEDIWALVQRHGGHWDLGRDSVDFYIPKQYESLLIFAYPELIREQQLSYVPKLKFS